MSESTNEVVQEDLINIEKMSIDQFAGSVVLILGAIGSLLLVIWQSRCACKCRIGLSESCYIFDCAREPPTQEQLQDLKEEAETLGPAGQANLEREKGNKVPSQDRHTPEEIRLGTYPEANDEPLMPPEPELEVGGGSAKLP